MIIIHCTKPNFPSLEKKTCILRINLLMLQQFYPWMFMGKFDRIVLIRTPPPPTPHKPDVSSGSLPNIQFPRHWKSGTIHACASRRLLLVQRRDGHHGPDSAGGPIGECHPHPHACCHLLRGRSPALTAPLRGASPD